MKKYLVALAALAVVFAGCKKEQGGGGGGEVDPSGLTKIEFKQTELSLLVGDTVRLVLLGTPAEVEIPASLTVASSDTDVVKVLDKKVTIVAEGSGVANVTAKVGNLTAVCQVTVQTYQEVWALDWIYYFPSTEEDFSKDTVELGGYKCLLKSYEFFMPNTLDFAEDLSYGDGECVFATGIVPVIAEGDYKGEMLARQFELVETEAELGVFTGLNGKIDPAVCGSIFQPYFEGLDQEEQRTIDWDTYESEGVTGAVIREAFITETGGISYYYQCDGIVTSGYFARAVDQEAQAYYFDYDITVNWFGGFWGLGLATNWEAESYSEVLIQPFATEFDCAYHYKAGAAAEPLVLNAAPRKIAKANKAKAGFVITREKPVRAKFAAIAR